MQPDYVYRERKTRTTFKFYHTGCDRHGNDQYRVTVRNNRVTVFESEGYRPSPVRRGQGTPRSMANDVCGFALAYCERPEEFGRYEREREQVCAAWWRVNGDNLSIGTESRKERA